MERAPYLVVGAGLAGLSSGIALGSDAVVLEREHRAGGLVRSKCVDGFWFDWVIHLLHVQEARTESLLLGLPDHHLERCPPEAWVETSAGVARFPIQAHLATLEPKTVERCIESLKHEASRASSAPRHYEDVLEQAFGKELCKLFFTPYNRKMWRRPLNEITADPSLWNLHRPSIDAVIRGADPTSSITPAYNSRAFYPRPPIGFPVRGMEVISAGMAAEVHDLRLQHEVVAIHPEDQTLSVSTPNGTQRMGWEKNLVNTMPLPRTIACCDNVPIDLRAACKSMVHNLVVSVGLNIRGQRPDVGHWRYYADPELPFTRLVFLHEFDPHMAPADGWPLLVEVPLRAEEGFSEAQVIEDVITGVRRCGVLPAGSEIEAAHVLVADPAYVCFSEESLAATEAALTFLRGWGIEPLGRYGRWQYLSMAQVIESGLALGAKLKEEP